MLFIKLCIYIHSTITFRSSHGMQYSTKKCSQSNLSMSSAQQQSFQQTPLLQAALPVQQQITLPQIQQPASQFASLPALQTLPYQITPQYQAYVPVQAVPQTLPGRSRQSIPRLSQYTVQDDYPHGRSHHHHRASRRRYRPYDSYSSFEDTYGASPGIFDDLKDISKYEF